MKTYTRDTDYMNEVLSDFILYNVLIKFKDGTSIWGQLEANPDEWTDGYKIGHFSFEKDDVMELTDMEDNR